MMKNSSESFDAYLDGDTIRIISSSGVDYMEKIQSTSTQFKKKKRLARSAMWVCIGMLFSFCTQALGVDFSASQNAVIVIFFIISGFVWLIAHDASDTQHKQLELYSASLNLAKKDLQGKLMDLEQQRVAHQMQLNALSNQQQFQFLAPGKQMEM